MKVKLMHYPETPSINLNTMRLVIWCNICNKANNIAVTKNILQQISYTHFEVNADDLFNPG